jgi:hypothetical protein
MRTLQSLNSSSRREYTKQKVEQLDIMIKDIQVESKTDAAAADPKSTAKALDKGRGARPFSSVVIGHETHGPLRSQGHRLLVERLSKVF